jgi:uncharacterized protein
MTESNFRDWARRKDEFMRSARSPLPPLLRTGFVGLPYHPYNPDLEFQAPLEPDPKREALAMPTSNGSQAIYERVGWFSFAVDGQTLRLAGFAREGDDHPEALFVPFKDTSSGLETYGGGRYLEAQLHDGTVAANFNFAYSPYCAYSEGWSCPIPPRENWLPLKILAGELLLEVGEQHE